VSIAVGLALALVACIISLVSVGAWRKIAAARNILDVPNDRSSHHTPTPRGGGFLFPVVVLAALVLPIESRQTWGVTAVSILAASVLLVALVSWWDDLTTVSPFVRIAAHIVAAGLAIAAIGYPSAVWVPAIGVVDIGVGGALMASLWIVGLTNAFNFMDGIDGIAGLQAFIAGLGWLVIGSVFGVPVVGLLGGLLSGVSLGFLAHNWPPARVFMGDVGSASLGFGFALITLMAADSDVRLLTAGPLLLWPFLFDTTFTFLRRLRRGDHVFSAHRTHLYQRLVIAGYTHRVVTIVYGLLATQGLLCAWLLVAGGPAARGLSLSALVAAALALWLVVERTEKSVTRRVHGNA
jgi:UDP-N-acetylmuramyl pentapeptide phosphotransferase/UDP-N-acetylglucosamine-1-phosphate transferase